MNDTDKIIGAFEKGYEKLGGKIDTLDEKLDKTREEAAATRGEMKVHNETMTREVSGLHRRLSAHEAADQKQSVGTEKRFTQIETRCEGFHGGGNADATGGRAAMSSEHAFTVVQAVATPAGPIASLRPEQKRALLYSGGGAGGGVALIIIALALAKLAGLDLTALATLIR